MRILTHDELPASLEAKVSLLNLGAGWGVFDFDRVRLARAMGYPFTDYYAVYTVEDDDEPLAKVETIHIELETRDGPETVCGIYSVLTRRDKSRLGLARSLLEDVHRREREGGVRHSILWTGRSNKAHNLYRSLGYVDVYDPPIALSGKRGESSGVPSKGAEAGLKLKNATVDDAPLLDEIHSGATAGRLGFAHRFKDFTKIIFDLDFEKPDSFRIITKEDDVPAGYVYFQRNPFDWVKCPELVVGEEYFEQAVSLLEREAGGSWLAFGNSFVSDARAILERRGYVFLNHSYSTLMACTLDPQESSGDDEAITNLLGANDPRFVCQGLDYF